MRKIFFLVSFFLLSIAGFCQFTFQVKLQGDCVYPETTKAAIYGIHLTVYRGTTVMAEETLSQGTTNHIFDVSLDEFCVNDNTPIYTIKVEAVKAFINPYDPICKGSGTYGTFSCEDFVDGLPMIVVELE